MIKAETIKSPDENHISCVLCMEGTPDETGMDMHAIIKGFTLNLLQNCVPGKELSMTMFLATRFAEAVHEAYQEYLQVKQHEATD